MAFLLMKTLRQVILPAAPVAGSLNLAVRALSASPTLQMKRPTFDRPLPPKRAPNAYMLFLLDSAQSVPKTDTGKLNLKAIGEMWRNLSLADAKVYQGKAAVEQIQYKKRYEEFLRSIGGKRKQEAYLEDLKEYKSEKREYMKNFRLKKKDLLKPRKKSGYNIFISELMKKAKVESLEDTQEVMKGAAVKWNALSGKMQEVYKEEATHLHEQQLKAFERRYKKAEKAGLVPVLDADGKKVKKTTKGAAKKGKTTTTTKKKVAAKKDKTLTAVEKAIAALLKNDAMKGVLAQTLKAQDLGAEGEVLAAALQQEEEAEAAKVVADSEEIASLAKEVSSEVEGVEPEEAEDDVEGDIFTDSDTETATSGTAQV